MTRPGRRALAGPASVVPALLLGLVLAACGSSGTPDTEAPAPSPATSAPSSTDPGAAPDTAAASPSPPRSVGQRAPARLQRGQRREDRRVAAQAQARRTAQAAAAAAAANPLAGRPWGVYTGAREPAWAPYERASGATKQALARIALAPKAVWFGAWIPDAQIGAKVGDYIANAQAGDPEALVQMTVFRMVPWEQETCRRLPSAAEQASYRTWIDRFAAAVGDTPAAIVLQPDGPFSLCAPGGPRVPAGLIAYAARTFSALPRTSVYIEVGAADWPAVGQGGVDQVLSFLLPAGIEAARGIALNGTHYSATEDEVARGTAVVEALAARGIAGKHFVVNTSGNGHPFAFGTYAGKDPLNADVCGSRAAGGTCITLGIPPTVDVADERWGLSEQARADARRYADGYLWFGRPWLYRQNDPFQLDRALALARSTPY